MSPLLCLVPEAAAGCEIWVPALGEDALETAWQWDFGGAEMAVHPSLYPFGRPRAEWD